MNQSRAAISAIAVAIPLAMLAAINSGAEPEEIRTAEPRLTIVASFYPLYEFAQQVSGDRAVVSSLVPAGIEPHDWDPTAAEVTLARSADLVIINGAGFESWANRIEGKIVDTSEGMELAAINPHVWLDPVLAKQQVEKIRIALEEADPENAQYYNDNAVRFSSELDSLDSKAMKELAGCPKSDFIAFHDAFSHFAIRYGLTQHSVHGASPEGEILPQRLGHVVRLANELDISVIYSEDLVDGRLAETIAEELPGGKVLVLSPIEGIGEDERARGIGYIEKMEQNIANLKEGLGCR